MGLKDFFETTCLGRYFVFKKAKQTVLSQTKGQYPAPLEILHVLRHTMCGSLTKRLEIEAKGFARLAPTPESKSLIQLFFLTEAFKKYTGVQSEVQPKSIQSTGVLGAGLMGVDAFRLFLNKDLEVRLKDIQWLFIAKAYQTAYDIFQRGLNDVD